MGISGRRSDSWEDRYYDQWGKKNNKTRYKKPKHKRSTPYKAHIDDNGFIRMFRNCIGSDGLEIETQEGWTRAIWLDESRSRIVL